MSGSLVGRALTALLVAIAPAAAQTGAPTAGQAGAQPDVRPQGTLTTAQLNDSALEARTSAVASQLRCPVCQGVSIQDSPSELAQQIRMVVKEQLATGKSPREVRAWFVSKYGEWILLSPEPKGFNWVVYVLPVALILGGIATVVMVVRRWTAQEAAEPSG